MRIGRIIGKVAVLVHRLFSKVVVVIFKLRVAANCFSSRPLGISAAAIFLGAALTALPVCAETRTYFEKWSAREGFDIGFACNWWKDVPGPESIFQVSKLKNSEILADIDSFEFRMIKPTTAETATEGYSGSQFSVRVDREAGSIVAVRVVYAFSKNGPCSFVLKATDGSQIEILKGIDAPYETPSTKAERWIEKTIADCHRRLRRAVDQNLVFDCVAPRNPKSDKVEPTDGFRSSIMPEGMVPASVARIYLEKHGNVFAFTVFGESAEVIKIGEQ